MWKPIQISPTETPLLFYDFDAPFMIAKCMKGCHQFYLSKKDRKMYGCNDEYFTIHSIDIPDFIEITNSISFKFAKLDISLIGEYRDFVLYPSNPWMMLPLETRADHPSYRIVYVDGTIGWTVVDSKGNEVPHLNLYGVDTEEGPFLNSIYHMVMAKKSIEGLLGHRKVFFGYENDPNIRYVMDNKATEGTRYLNLKYLDGSHYGMFVFKNLFNLNKTDTLSISIRDRMDNPTLYEASFITTKKKSPIPDVLPTFQETACGMFLNIR